MNTSHELPIACNINALDTTQQERHATLAKHMNNATLQVQELPDGYKFLYPASISFGSCGVCFSGKAVLSFLYLSVDSRA